MPRAFNSAVPFTVADFPGYAECVAREQKIRRAACFGLNEIICGLEVRPLTAAHVSLLTMLRSPFLCGYTAGELVGTAENDFLDGKPDLANDIMLFLWIVSPMYEAGSKASVPSSEPYWFIPPTPPVPTARDRFNDTFAPVLKMSSLQVVREILEYVDEAFIDAGEPDGTGKSYYTDEVAIAYELSRHHGYRLDFWRADCPPEKNPLNVPLKIVFQLRKVRRHTELGDEAGLTNKSDKLIAAGLPKLGERHREQNRLN